MSMAPPAAAQDLGGGLPSTLPPGGEALEFSVGQRVEWRDGDRDAATTIEFGYRSQTRTQLFEVAADTRLDWGAEDAPEVLPSLSLAYRRDGQSTALALDAVWTRQDLSVFDPLRLLDLEGPVTIDDLTRLFDAGQRIDRGISFDYSMGQGGPVRSTLSVNASETTYENFGATAEVPSDRQSLAVGLDLAFDVTSAASLTVGLDWRALEVTGEQRRVTRAIDLGYVIDRPRGDLRFGLSHAEGPEGGRTTASVGRSVEFPLGTLDARIGVTRNAAEEIELTGSLGLSRAFRTGSLSLDVERRVRTGAEGELLTTSLAAEYNRSLSRTVSFSADASWLRVEEVATDSTAETARLGLSVGYALTRDWQANLGASYTVRDSDTTGRDSDRTVFLGIERSFAIRP